MIGLAAGTQIWIVAGVTDMRRGFTGLSGMVQTALQEKPFSGQVYIFRGRRGDLILLFIFSFYFFIFFCFSRVFSCT
jgi:transposase